MLRMQKRICFLCLPEIQWGKGIQMRQHRDKSAYKWKYEGYAGPGPGF